MPETQHSQQSRYQRVSKPTPIIITERDVAIVETVHQHRLMSQAQLKTLFFPSSRAAQPRLRELFDHRYLEGLS